MPGGVEPHRTGRAYTDPPPAGQPSVASAIARCAAFKATATRPRYSIAMATPDSLGERSHPIPTRASSSERPLVADNIARNIFVARHLGARSEASAVIASDIGIALLAAAGMALVLTATMPAAIDGLLTVGCIGLAAGRFAATMGDRRSPSVGRRPANDNPCRPVLPPSLLRC